MLMFNQINQRLQQMQEAVLQAALQPFRATYKCYSMAFANKPNLETGDKILLPPSALDRLARLHVTYPMMFKVSNPSINTHTHCGVMEFSSEEGVAHLPYWMMENLGISDGSIITVDSTALPKGTYVKLQPHMLKFTQIPNPRAVLERTLRSFSCLTKGDTIKIVFDNMNYYLDVVEVRPGNAISVIETDMQVEFDPPKDMKEAEEKTEREQASQLAVSNVESKNDGSGDATVTSQRPSSVSISPSDTYFSNLGTGYSLKSKPRGPAAAPSATAPSPSLSPSSSTVPMESSSSSSGHKLVTTRKGNFDYVYEMDERTKKQRLLRRVAVDPKKNESTFKAFGGSGNKLV